MHNLEKWLKLDSSSGTFTENAEKNDCGKCKMVQVMKCTLWYCGGNAIPCEELT